MQHTTGRAPALAHLRQNQLEGRRSPRTSRTDDFGGAGGSGSVGTWP
ncbi:hypothetical protein [Streptomyces sp. H39-C1]|nr:hypothetical protein [Streptomyces sp. H39-C1]MCZ4100994.1 hypothetical protein [Streptomyces sp. H39-C1]